MVTNDSDMAALDTAAAPVVVAGTAAADKDCKNRDIVSRLSVVASALPGPISGAGRSAGCIMLVQVLVADPPAA
jgi:hypothetical protein